MQFDAEKIVSAADDKTIKVRRKAYGISPQREIARER
jgi:hypothetical protein